MQNTCIYNIHLSIFLLFSLFFSVGKLESPKHTLIQVVLFKPVKKEMNTNNKKKDIKNAYVVKLLMVSDDL
jgi:hypothetical protein